MVSILSRRADDVRNPGQHRQQGTRSETVIGMDILQPEPGGRAAMHQPATTTASARAADVQVPPPAYTGLELPLVRTSSSGRTLVNPTGSRRRWKTVQIEWAYHPAISGRWYIYRLLRFLRMDKEVLKPGFPEVFEELLDEGHVDLSEQEKIRELYAARISHLNEWVIPTLAATRLWMALTEVCIVLQLRTSSTV